MYTYAFAFYLVKNNQCMIFEVSAPPPTSFVCVLCAVPLLSPSRTTKETLKWLQSACPST